MRLLTRRCVFRRLKRCRTLLVDRSLTVGNDRERQSGSSGVHDEYGSSFLIGSGREQLIRRRRCTTVEETETDKPRSRMHAQFCN